MILLVSWWSTAKKSVYAPVESMDERGYLVSGFNSGMEALEALKEQRCDILLLDLEIPDINGIELLNKALEVDSSIYCIVMTDFGTVEAAVKA